jgi:capsule polysaccharide export protein KpsC/LpsZ
MKLSHFNPLALLHHVANILYKRKISLIVKPHPKCFDQELLLLIDALNKEKKIEIYHGSIHTAIKKATAVYVINSGVGFEALMHLKPVITFGKADYSLVTTTIKTVHELENKPIPTLTTEQKENIKLFLHFYIHTYLLDVNDKSSIIKNLNTFQLNSLWSMKIKSHESIEQWALTKQHTWDSKKKKTALLIGFESFMMKYMRDYLNNYNISYFDRHFSHIMMLKIIKKYYPSISIFIDKSFIKKEAFFIQTLYENNINFNIVEDGPIRSMGVYSTETRPLSLYIYKNTTSFKKTVANQLKKSSIEKRKLTKKIMEAYRKHHISKYSMPTLVPHINSISLNPNSTIILGSTDTTHDLKVIKQIKSNTDTPIFYKKHPNTISVHQPVYFNDAIENIVSIIPAEIPLSHILLYANEIHSLDSGAGFETLLYSKNVICHSPTWYSCYHLTQNTFKEKQYKGFTIEDLFWAAYIKLPIYYLNTIEETINKVSKQKDLYCTSNHTIR